MDARTQRSIGVANIWRGNLCPKNLCPAVDCNGSIDVDENCDEFSSYHFAKKNTHIIYYIRSTLKTVAMNIRFDKPP